MKNTNWKDIVAVRSICLSILIALFGHTAAFAQIAVDEEPSWKWPESRWRAAVNQVRAGARLLPESWPEGGRVAVTLSFDLDTETLMLRNGITSPSRLSTGQYGGPRRASPGTCATRTL